MITTWSLVEYTSRLLERDEREVVLGDLLESNESSWLAFLDVLGLIFRRQIGLWANSRPWVSSLGIAFPASYLLSNVSISVSCTYARLFAHKIFPDHYAPTGHEGFGLFLCHVFLLLTWSWISGYLVGSLSRPTVWVSGILCAGVCIFNWNCFPFDFSRATVFLFLVPAMLGVYHGFRRVRVSAGGAVLLAAAVVVLMCTAWSANALWIVNWILLWPVWLLVDICTAGQRPTSSGQVSALPQVS
jgi:hypothetical protein